MTDQTPDLALAERFAALIALVDAKPSAVLEHREAARGVTEAALGGAVRFSLVDGAFLLDGAPFEAPLLAARFASYGIEELGITERVAQADILEVARLLAAAPGEGDQVARFAARQTALDPKTLPRRLRARTVADGASSAGPPVAPAALPSAPAKRGSGKGRRLTPTATSEVGTGRKTPGALPAIREARNTPRVQPAVSAASTTPAAQAEIPSPRPSGPQRRFTPTSLPSTLPSTFPPPALSTEARNAPERLVAAIEIPETAEGTLTAARAALELAETPKRLTAALDQLVILVELAFRQGRHDDLVDALTTLVGLEFELLERDSSDERRQALNHAVRTLARPVLLRQLAVLRHTRAADAVAAERLQQVIYRFGVDGVEAVIDEFASAPSAAARETCLECLRGLRRTYDALFAFARDPREPVVRQTAQLLGELHDARADAILVELLQHPDARTRRIAVAALANSEREDALGAVAFSLDDESPLVRLRAVAALAGRRGPDVLRWLRELIDREADREVLYSAIAAIGAIATPEAVQALIPIAAGDGENPLRRSAAMRIQACTALAIIRTPSAMSAVQLLRTDRDREVREASVRLVAQARRRTTSTGIAAISVP